MKKTTHKQNNRAVKRKSEQRKPAAGKKTQPVKKMKSQKKNVRPAKRKHKKVNKQKKKLRKTKILFFEIVLTLLVTIGILSVLSLFTFSFAKVEGYSMSDTLDDGEVVVVNKLSKIKRFDLVYLKVPKSKDKSIRRIIGQPGESLYYKNGQLFIDEQEKDESFIDDYKNQFEQDGMLYTEDFTLKSLSGRPTIPKGKYLVLGDNRPYATDSRYYQLVDEKEIIGKVEMRVLPLHKLQRVK
ncbi:signal peptidase I [Enterococcus sp. 7E2_DIV0204]|uniref:signal peptidase I n=1 Tax=unclassified Enterococcus TaxID=2608891 RepID=UPI000B755FEA|nr:MULTISPECIES: signal peptidase I [unclassified Enterococcus]OTN88322.1 signal peptidase I [Enterococcus sp. 7E2_DIV0204]OTP48174.1 signal peptidase I [Enterococcus sp. 7D2_DIV0200]